MILKEPVWDDLSFVKWCVILLEAATRRSCSVIRYAAALKWEFVYCLVAFCLFQLCTFVFFKTNEKEIDNVIYHAVLVVSWSGDGEHYKHDLDQSSSVTLRVLIGHQAGVATNCQSQLR